jgi:N-acetylglucosaminyldiphosphoundecaprenol N-acetyl-beta-D-mannosaminyltransferase
MADHDPVSVLTLDRPAAHDAAPPPDDRVIPILGVNITDVTAPRAIGLMEEMIEQFDGRARSVFFANAHTLNLAAADEDYRQVLNAADYVFGDGTGVRWAARLQKIRVRDNLIGTELTPALLHALAGRGYRYYLLGGDEALVRRAARYAAGAFPGWVQAGYHHGYPGDRALTAKVIRRINAARPDVLLVGMGNPLQERWIHAHQYQLEVPLCMGVGGLFGYWAGDLRRAPSWLRRWGWEWLGILCQQPHKARRYLLGNPLFLWRIGRERWITRRRHARR